MATTGKATGLKRLVRAFGHSMAGLNACYRHEEAFRLEALATLGLIPLALWLGDDGTQRALLVGSWLLVPVVELLNSAVEAVVDRVGPERHELSGRAKDAASAAVLVSLVFAAAVWALILLPGWI